MTKPEQYNGLLQNMQADIRLEVILADMIAESLHLDDVVIVSNSLFRRNYHYDIENIGEIDYGVTKKKKLCFVVNREGIYDLLPEDLFHQVADTQKDTDKEITIQEIKVQNELEKQSRLFFLPFEQEFYRQRIKLEAEERKFLFETNNVLPCEIFDYLWELPELLDDLQKSKLGLLIPVLNKVAGNLELARLIIEIITGDNIKIMETAPGKFIVNDEPQLGEMQLGVNSIFSGQLSALQSGFTVYIFLSAIERLADYMPGGKSIIVYEFLCNLLMPLDSDIVFELDLSNTTAEFIAENETAYSGRLNYSTII
jgi:hypothetical protein